MGQNITPNDIREKLTCLTCSFYTVHIAWVCVAVRACNRHHGVLDCHRDIIRVHVPHMKHPFLKISSIDLLRY